MKSATMNKRSFLLLAIAFFACQSLTFAQTAKDVFGNSETPILYLGIDFTKAKIIDEPTTKNYCKTGYSAFFYAYIVDWDWHQPDRI